MPLQRAGVRVERDDRGGVEIVARAGIAIPVGTSVAHTPIGQVRFGIVRTRHPDRTAAGLPRVAAPCFAPRLSWSGDRVEPPHFLARLRIERRQEPPNAV